MIDKPIANALLWWIKKNGKYKSGCVSTQEGEVIETDGKSTTIKGDGTFSISKWDVDGVNEPDEKTILSILSDYDKYLANEKVAYDSRRAAFENKLVVLGITLSEIKEFIN